MLDFTDPKIQGSWRGKVKNNNDPDQNKRLKVFIKPLHDGIADADLPWAVPVNEGQLGASQDGSYGEGGVPNEGSWVKVTFEQGDPSSPQWHGTIEPADSLPDRFLGNQDTAYDTINSNATSIEPGAETGSYPDSRGWVLESGIVVEAEDSGSPRILIFHPSGFRFEVLSDGVHVKHVENDDKEIVIGDKEQDIDGDWTINIQGSAEILGSDISIGNGALDALVKATEVATNANSHSHPVSGIMSGSSSTTSGPPANPIIDTSKASHVTKETEAS